MWLSTCRAVKKIVRFHLDSIENTAEGYCSAARVPTTVNSRIVEGLKCKFKYVNAPPKIIFITVVQVYVIKEA